MNHLAWLAIQTFGIPATKYVLKKVGEKHPKLAPMNQKMIDILTVVQGSSEPLTRKDAEEMVKNLPKEK